MKNMQSFSIENNRCKFFIFSIFVIKKNVGLVSLRALGNGTYSTIPGIDKEMRLFLSVEC
jgi:hypothetical protein